LEDEPQALAREKAARAVKNNNGFIFMLLLFG
jgi:hypothetical protein